MNNDDNFIDNVLTAEECYLIASLSKKYAAKRRKLATLLAKQIYSKKIYDLSAQDLQKLYDDVDESIGLWEMNVEMELNPREPATKLGCLLRELHDLAELRLDICDLAFDRKNGNNPE